MDFDDGNWNFRGVLSVVGGSSPMRSPWSFKSKYVAVDLAAKKVKDTWYRSGYIRFESNGLQIPNKEPLSFGRTVLTAPDFPDQQSYRILFTPVQWLGNGRLRFWEFIPTRKAVRPSPIDPREFTSQEIELLQTSGLDPEKLRLSPESLEIVLPLLISLRTPQSGSILTEIKTLIEQLSTMASTDIRTMLQNLETIGIQTTSNAADLAAQSVTLADVKATAVVEKNFTIAKAAFLLEGNVYRAPIAHMMKSRSPGVTIYDADGDLQLAEFIAIDADNAKLELSVGQYADNAFPLTVNVQARMVSASTRGGVDIGGGVIFSLMDGVLARFENGGWMNYANSVTAAKYSNNRVVYLVNGNESAPMISQSSNGYGPEAGNAQDWLNEGNSPFIPA